MTAREVCVIVSDDVLLGTGETDDPFRRATSFYTIDGALLVQVDPGIGVTPRFKFSADACHLLIQEGVV